jgi:membrane associated rhomboid family serine protease
MLKIGSDISASSQFANEPSSPNQWFRFIFPIFIHAGIIHAVVLLAIQYYFGTKIERQVGVAACIAVVVILA